MDCPTTLKSLLAEHPEWGDLPIGIYRSDGAVDFAGASGTVYEVDMDDDGKMLIFAGN